MTKLEKVLISPTRTTLTPFWEWLNIKFYDRYSSFSLFILISVPGTGAWPAQWAMEPGDGARLRAGMWPLDVLKGSCSWQPSYEAWKTGPWTVAGSWCPCGQPSFRPRDSGKDRHGLAQESGPAGKFSNKDLKINVTLRLRSDSLWVWPTVLSCTMPGGSRSPSPKALVTRGVSCYTASWWADVCDVDVEEFTKLGIN